MNFKELAKAISELTTEQRCHVRIESFTDDIFDVHIIQETPAGRFHTETPFTADFLDDVNAATFKELCEVHMGLRKL